MTWRSKYLGDGESGIWGKDERVWKSFWNLSYSFPPTIRHSGGIPVKPGEKLRTLRKILGENESWGEGNEETVPVVKPKDFWHWTDNFDFWLCFLFAGKDLESIFLVTAACEEKWSFSSCIPSLFPCPLQQVAAFYGNARKICSNFPWTPPLLFCRMTSEKNIFPGIPSHCLLRPVNSPSWNIFIKQHNIPTFDEITELRSACEMRRNVSLRELLAWPFSRKREAQ